MALMDRLYDRLRDPAAFKVGVENATSCGLEAIKGSQYALLVTFRRNGTPVPSPVWLAVDSAGRGYLHTGNTSGKVKRIRNYPEVLVAASTMRGRPKGPTQGSGPGAPEGRMGPRRRHPGGRLRFPAQGVLRRFPDGRSQAGLRGSHPRWLGGLQT